MDSAVLNWMPSIYVYANKKLYDLLLSLKHVVLEVSTMEFHLHMACVLCMHICIIVQKIF